MKVTISIEMEDEKVVVFVNCLSTAIDHVMNALLKIQTEKGEKTTDETTE